MLKFPKIIWTQRKLAVVRDYLHKKGLFQQFCKKIGNCAIPHKNLKIREILCAAENRGLKQQGNRAYKDIIIFDLIFKKIAKIFSYTFKAISWSRNIFLDLIKSINQQLYNLGLKYNRLLNIH